MEPLGNGSPVLVIVQYGPLDRPVRADVLRCLPHAIVSAVEEWARAVVPTGEVSHVVAVRWKVEQGPWETMPVTIPAARPLKSKEGAS